MVFELLPTVKQLQTFSMYFALTVCNSDFRESVSKPILRVVYFLTVMSCWFCAVGVFADNSLNANVLTIDRSCFVISGSLVNSNVKTATACCPAGLEMW